MTVQQARKIQETAAANLQSLSFGEQAMWTLIEHLDKRIAFLENEHDANSKPRPVEVAA